MAAPPPKVIRKLEKLASSGSNMAAANSFSTIPSDVVSPSNASQQAALTSATVAPATTPPSTEDALAQAFQVGLTLSPSSNPLDIAHNGFAATTRIGDRGDASAQELIAKEHPDFPSEKGKTHFLVENTLFAVYASILAQHSPVFRDMFALGPRGTTEGSKTDPIKLPSLKALHFERCLKILFPRRYDKPLFETVEEWASVLCVAGFYEFRDCGLWDLALKQLEKTATSVEKIVQGKQLRVKSLLLQGLRELCGRTTCLTEQELAQLPMGIVNMLMSRREGQIYSFERCRRCCVTVWPRILDAELASLFKISTTSIPLFIMGGSTYAAGPMRRLTIGRSNSRWPTTNGNPPMSLLHPGTLTFYVRGKLFTVPRHVANLESAGYNFRHTFNLENSKTNSVPGAGTKQDPFILREISRADFAKFSRILFPRLGEKHTAEDWRFVLRIAMSGIFNFSRSEVISLSTSRILETASTIQKIVWGEELKCEPLRIAGYREICNRVTFFTGLTVSELEQLNFKTIELICHAREVFIRQSRCEDCVKRGLSLSGSDDTLAKHFAKLLLDVD
ncbi:hypothetical protein SCHPADRAFT_674520 [Schizopora paradoxa]|uniref:BTB domain-containing protein n=1 Tax=Schizopora paradoxa TaxID=27342 RepID=A0A0H2RPX0_9AGAM|nr:hypothetical protein SCHPADRAFT_674520 [Schizopora paradoxa]